MLRPALMDGHTLVTKLAVESNAFPVRPLAPLLLPTTLVATLEEELVDQLNRLALHHLLHHLRLRLHHHVLLLLHAPPQPLRHRRRRRVPVGHRLHPVLLEPPAHPRVVPLQPPVGAANRDEHSARVGGQRVAGELGEVPDSPQVLLRASRRRPQRLQEGVLEAVQRRLLGGGVDGEEPAAGPGEGSGELADGDDGSVVELADVDDFEMGRDAEGGGGVSA